MSWSLSLALYIVIWWTLLFAVLPFGVRTQGEDGKVVPGTPASAPSRMNIKRVIIATTLVSAVVFALVRFVIASQWIKLDTLGVPGG
jgi:predicted secreted protein